MTRAKRDGDRAQAVECLCTKHETFISNPSTTKKKNKERKKKKKKHEKE
jgi:hypothetical protein